MISGNKPQPVPHPRTLGWGGATVLAMGGSNQSLFLIASLMSTQGSASVPLLICGLLLSFAMTPGWTELVLMWPHRVGGISATCAEAFRPISGVLANLAGSCYWWGWVSCCSLCAFLAADLLHRAYLPRLPVALLAGALIVGFALLALGGVRFLMRAAIPLVIVSGALAVLSVLLPILSGQVDWRQAITFRLHTPFEGVFGQLTSAMAGLHLVGFAAPAFEAAATHAGEIVHPNRNLPRAMLASAAVAAFYFAALPIVWLGAFGPQTLTGELDSVLGPAFAPVFGAAGRHAAIWFLVLNLWLCMVTPLAGAARTLAQLSEDGLLPRFFSLRCPRTDAPWAATLLTAGVAMLMLLLKAAPWMIAACSFAYLIGICLPSVAVWLLRKQAPEVARPYRAPKGTITLGLLAAGVWMAATVFGFGQFGLPTVLAGLGLAYSGALLYACRRARDAGRTEQQRPRRSLHTKLTGAMLFVLGLNAGGYLLALEALGTQYPAFTTALRDIFVVVALLTISVGLILPGVVAHTAQEVAGAADRLAKGTAADLSRAMRALARGDMDAARARVDLVPLPVHADDELGQITAAFNAVQLEMAHAAIGLNGARDGLRRAHRQLAESNRRFELAVEGSQDGIWDWNPRTGKVYYSPRYKAMLGYNDDEMPSRMEEFDRRLHPDDRERVQATMDSYLAGNLPTYQAEFRLRHRDGSYRWILARASALRDEAGKPTRMSGSHSDITDRKQAEDTVMWHARHDVLTGLPNRVLFQDRLGQAIASAERHGEQVAVLYLDLDRFKHINDSLGHAAGDAVLQAVSERLSDGLRAEDTVARIGGDEFTFLLPALPSPLPGADQAARVAQKLLGALSEPIHIQSTGQELWVSASIGISLFPDDGQDSETLLKNADVAMYRAKEQGRNGFQLFSEHMNAQAFERLFLENSLHKALERGEFVLHYQPQVSLATGAITGVEALVRWDHPELGLVAPGRFIPLAEEMGLIEALGEWVLQTACRQAAAWAAAGCPLRVAVNLSGRQFRQRLLVETVRRALAESGLPSAYLDLELTEGMLMDNRDDAVRTLDELKALGVALSVDDFGTGYSSLSYLRRFPLDVLKLDRSFVTPLTQDVKNEAVVRAIIELAHALDLTVIAEGVETVCQKERLIALGCDAMQGYLFSPPLPVEKLETLLPLSPASTSSPSPV